MMRSALDRALRETPDYERLESLLKYLPFERCRRSAYQQDFICHSYHAFPYWNCRDLPE